MFRDHFYSTRLNKPSNDDFTSLCRLKRSIGLAMKDFNKKSTIDYPLFAAMLNKISSAVWAKFLSKNKDLIEFLVVTSETINHHPNDEVDGRPDLIAVSSSTAKALKKAKASPCWHHVLSLVEPWQVIDLDAPASTCGTYLALANQARPNMVGMYGIVVTNHYYQILYSSPGGLETSDPYFWEDLEPLILYVYTLYHPRTDQIYYDSTITLSQGLSIQDPPKWDVQVGDEVHKNCTVLGVGRPWHYLGWVARTPGDTPFIIKDTFQYTEGPLRQERSFYEEIHKDGVFSGVAAIKESFDVTNDGKAIAVIEDDVYKIKTRLIMATSGDPVSSCNSVVAFLKIMYDILEAHRWVVSEKQILHRDISMGNIIINPVDATEVPPFVGECRPKFINEVLDSTKQCAPPMGRLIDLDSAAKYGHDRTLSLSVDGELDEEMVDVLQFNAGTYPYKSRSIASTRMLVDEITFQPMPTLTEDALTCYQRAYLADDKDPLRSLSDDATGTIHSGKYDKKKRDDYARFFDHMKEEWMHHPRHDAESVFWCMVHFLILALPKGAESKPDPTSTKSAALWDSFIHNKVAVDSTHDPRSCVFQFEKWEDYLHEELSRFAPVLSELAGQVRPEYACLEPPPHPLHLHEAMQRILFKYIHKFQREAYDVELLAGKTRSPPKKDTVVPPSDSNGACGSKAENSRKRPVEAMSDSDGTHKAKRTRKQRSSAS